MDFNRFQLLKNVPEPCHLTLSKIRWSSNTPWCKFIALQSDSWNLTPRWLVTITDSFCSMYTLTHTHTHTHTHRSLLFHPFGNAVTNTGSRSPNFKWLYLLSTFQVTNILELHKLCLIFPRICMMVTLIFIFKIWKQGHKMNSFAKITHLQFEPT